MNDDQSISQPTAITTQDESDPHARSVQGQLDELKALLAKQQVTLEDTLTTIKALPDQDD